jgi:hypothetical protein
MMSQDDSVMALRIQLHESPCPTCGSYALVPMLHCDYYPDGCLWMVGCDACQGQFHLDIGTGPPG